MTKEKEYPEITRVSFIVEKGLDKEIERFAYVNEITKSDIMRTAVVEFLDRENKKKGKKK